MNARRLQRLAGFVFAATIVALLPSCEKMSIYEVRIAALRSLEVPEDPIKISLWLYPESGDKKIFEYFDKREITGTGWVTFNGSDFVGIAQSYLTENSYFIFRLKLNPNRFATPPDAVFEASVPLMQLLSPDRPQPVPLVVRAAGGAPFVVRLEFRTRPEKTDSGS